MDLDIRKEVLAAHDRIKDHIRKTPAEYSPSLSELCDCQVYLKLENWQVTGSFKVRGALNKILPLGLQKNNIAGVVAASTGNHAAAVAHSLNIVDIPGVIFLPDNTLPSKVEKLRYYKRIKLEFYGSDCVLAEKAAKEYCRENGMIYISPYNDKEIIPGQGTIGYEILEQVKTPDAVFVPVGGGGLMAGITGYMKNTNRNIKITGCQPENSAVMFESVRRGEIVDMPSLPTISDGTAGGVEEGSITFDFCRTLVDDWVLVSEDEILLALKKLLYDHNMMVEGAAGLALAALMKNRSKYRGKQVVLILCGSKFSPDLLERVLKT